MKRTFKIYRYDPEKDAKPYMQTIEVELDGHERMLLDALMKLKAQDPTLSFRRSCREGVCGSDAMNINGKNGLACITNLRELRQPIVLKPLPGLPVVRDLIVDMTQFFKQYHSVQPFLINENPPPEKSVCSRQKIAKSSTGFMSAFCAPAAQPVAPLFGGIRINSWAPRVCFKPIALLQTPVIRPPQHGLTTLKTPTACFAATPS